jgi:hypothetical protein
MLAVGTRTFLHGRSCYYTLNCVGSLKVVELAIEKLKSHKSPGIDQIPAELVKAGVGQFAVRFIN